MSIEKKKSAALKFLEGVTGGPLSFGNLLESIRLSEEISQVDFSKKLSISKAHLCDLERGRRAVSVARAAKFAKILGFSPERFVKLVFQGELDRERIALVVEVRKIKKAK